MDSRLKSLAAAAFSAAALSGCIIGPPQGRGGYQLYRGGSDECGFALDSYTGKPMKWKASELPISFYTHESVPLEAHRNFISSVEHWNSVWEEHADEMGIEAAPLFAIVSESQVFSGRPGKDGYNMLFFINENFAARYGAGKPTVQAVTVTFDDDPGEIIDTDIIINAETIDYFYDRDYDRDILAMAETFSAKRYLSSTESPGLWAAFKSRLLFVFRWIFGLFKRPESIQREVAARRPKVPSGHVDFPSLIIHELGHSPGLAHIEDKRMSPGRGPASKGRGRGSFAHGAAHSVMKRNLPSGTSRRNIREYDVKNLFCGYYGDKSGRQH